MDILYEDNHCLAVNKPAGLPAQGDQSGDPSLVDAVMAYLRERYGKPGNVYVGLVHRLDRPTSGVVLVAKTSKAAGRLSAQFRAGTVSKVYWAIVERAPHDEEGVWIDWLGKDRRNNRACLLPEGDAAGKEARVSYRVRQRRGDRALIELRPWTGRSHQLRVQLARRGFPILGDGKYGATTRLVAGDGRSRIALHSRELTFRHPTRQEAIVIEAPIPADWPELSPTRPARRCGSSTPGERSSP
ncbi:MAG TPA: RluA family pseudouridine synthase [Isosphaeraceae bacterium]|nr:RluA family pseudouridine synthase [Isosphaeraceae bacterium]